MIKVKDIGIGHQESNTILLLAVIGTQNKNWMWKKDPIN